MNPLIDSDGPTPFNAPLLPSHRIDPALLNEARAEMKLDGAPGLALGVYHDGKVASAGLGINNLRHPQPVDGSTMFQIGSITKTLTVTAILQLVEQGRLGLDDRVRAHLPGFAVADPQASEAATIRDCMTHSSGWEGDLYENSGWGDDALAVMVNRMTKLPQVTPLGKMWSYNNAAFYVLGRILELLHGRPYEEVIQNALLTPLGMDGACFFAHDMIDRKFAVGHVENGGETVVALPWAMPRGGNPLGGLLASADHVMRYARFQLDGAPVLSDKLRSAAFEPAGPSSDTPEIGLGWWLDDTSGERVVYHTGGANGQPCLLAMIPSRRFALAILTNGGNGGITAQRLLKWAMLAYFGLSASKPHAELNTAPDAWIGTFETRLERWTIRRENGTLKMDCTVIEDWLENMSPRPSSQEGIDVRPIGSDEMLIAPGQRAERIGTVLRDLQGDIRWLRVGRWVALRR